MSAHSLNPLPISTSSLQTSATPAAPKPWSVAPFPAPQETHEIPRAPLPAWPDPETRYTPPANLSAFQGISPLPPASLYGTAPAAEFHPAFPALDVFAGASAPAPAPAPSAKPVPPVPTAPLPDFTDEDLRAALSPLFKQVIDRHSAVAGDWQLEPMLRATIRRALAEYSPGTRPFQQPGGFDRLMWRLQALFTSRTYEDILFQKTHRFQIEEVFLLDASSLALVSYASSNPARHASPRRIENTVQRLAIQLRDEEGRIRPSFKLPDSRNVFSHGGQFITMMAVVRGVPNEMALTDLAFSVERIEERFRERFQIQGSPLLKALQPFLEDCLLIQAPASAA